MKIENLLEEMVRKKASDMHVGVGEKVSLRVNGKLYPVNEKHLDDKAARELIFGMLTEEQVEEFERIKELDSSFSVPGLSRFRVNVFFQRGGIGAAIRVIPNEIPTLEEIGLGDIAPKLTTFRNGLVLVTGRAGSGKSTTLASMINFINEHRDCHVVTIEDPIEFIYPKGKSIINQRELNIHTLSFANALKHVLRQDAEVVLVGEMRDLETISATITIAETGCLVFATLHTLDAAQTVDRIIDVFPPYQQQQLRMQLSLVLRAVISQQLLPTKDGEGRAAAREILVVNKAISNHIRENKTHLIYSSLETSRSLGMNTMEQAVSELYRKGVIDREAAIKSVNNPQFLNI